jgi:AcrR family transcriptional regulator
MARGARPRRRTQSERRSTSQAAILTTALRILSEEGYAAFSASGVAARAGVSRGALEHYYSRKQNLIAAATQHAMREAVDHARALAQTAHKAADPIEKFLSDSEHFFFRPVFRAMIEIMIACRSDPALAKIVNPIVLDARRTLNGIWTDTLVDAGYPRGKAERFIEITHYTLRGVFLVSNWLPYPMDRRAIMEDWKRIAAAVLDGDVLSQRSPRRTRRPSRPARR